MKYLFFLYCFIENIYSMNNDNDQIINKKCLEILLSIKKPINCNLYFPKETSDIKLILQLNNLCNNHPNAVKNFSNFLNTETELTNNQKATYKNIMNRIYYGE
jgi:hypothetical protein